MPTRTSYPSKRRIAYGGRHKQEEFDILVEQWEGLMEDVKGLRPRVKVLSQEAISFLKQDFTVSLTQDRKDIDRWIKDFPIAFKHYPLARLEWLEGFHMLVGESDDLSEDGPSFSVPRQVEGHPWWGWYEAIRGTPPEHFPPDLNWWVCLHRYYLSKPH